MPTLEAPIVAVTVYSDRARVTRQGTVTLAPGEQTVTLDGLPATLEEDSVRAGGRGAGVRILSVEVATQYVNREPEESVSDLREQLEQRYAADRALIDAETAETDRRAFLDSLGGTGSRSLARALAKGSATIDTVTALSDYLSREGQASQGRSRDLARQREQLAPEIAALQARLNAVQPAESRERREIRVTVEATAAATFQLEVVYAVRGASWTPLYDLRLIENRVSVTYLAHVRQQTGEDWPAVPLALSTARPAVSATIPELGPWYLDVYRPMPVPRPPMQAARGAAGGGFAAPASMAMPMDMDDARDGLFQQEAPAQVAEAAIESSGGASVTYRVARPIAVPADGAPHRTTVTTLDLEAALDYVTVPKLAEEAYLRARVKNTSAYTLLPGSAAIFHGDDFVGNTTLKTVAPGEEFKVQLGVDDRVKVARELADRDTSKNFIGNNRRSQLAYKITLTNHLPGPAHVLVYDQVPLSRLEEIKAKLQDANPRPTDQTGLNVLQWDLVLESQGKRELDFSFLLEHPRTMRLIGIA
jgi:uncharacterized protein (TIGR02231 family)